MPSFNVVITVSGLFCWTRNRDGEEPLVRVLVPKTDSMPEMQHFPRLVYDAAYENRGANRLARNIRCIPLEGRTLTVPAGLGDAVDTTLPTELLDLNTVANAPRIPTEFLTGDPTGMLATRITLGSGRCTSSVLGPMATYGAATLSTTTSIEWTITVEGKAGLDGLVLSGAGDALPTLYPMGGTIHLHLLCALREQLRHVNPGGPVVINPAAHFHMYFLLWQDDPRWTRPSGQFLLGSDTGMKGGCHFSGTPSGTGELVSLPSGQAHVMGHRLELDGTAYLLPTAPFQVFYPMNMFYGLSCGKAFAAS
jgi:hypothetical protein